MFIECEHDEHHDHHPHHHGCPLKKFRQFWHAFRLLTSPMHHTDIHHMLPLHHPGHHMEDHHGEYLLRGEPHFWTGPPPPPPMEKLPPPPMPEEPTLIQEQKPEEPKQQETAEIIEIVEMEKPREKEGEFYKMKITMLMEQKPEVEESKVAPRR